MFTISAYYMQNAQPKYKLKVVMIIFGQSWETVQKTAPKHILENPSLKFFLLEIMECYKKIHHPQYF